MMKPDWFWMALATGLFLAIAYAWTRRRSTAGATGAGETSPSASSAADVATTSEAPPKKTGKKPKRRTAESQKAMAASSKLPRLEFDEEVDPTKVGAAAGGSASAPETPEAKKIVYDEDAAVEERTAGGALILVTGTAQTDTGLRRQRNEDAILVMPEHGVYVVADGMGGHRGGEVASSMAAKTIEQAFLDEKFDGQPHPSIPRRASELARAIQMANSTILRRAEKDRELAGMGTTVCAARFSANKQRLYIGHVGDSRMYRLRDGVLSQLTSDHTMGDLGVKGEAATHLSRAVGVWPSVPVDVILCRPRPRDIYLLCSDGLTKMLSDERIGQILHPTIPPMMVVEALIDAANAKGGKDNVSVIVIRVDDATVGSVGSN